MTLPLAVLEINSRFLTVSAIRVVLRGKAHAEWKVVVSGDKRTVKDDQYFIDERATIWGKGEEGSRTNRGLHLTLHFKCCVKLKGDIDRGLIEMASQGRDVCTFYYKPVIALTMGHEWRSN